MSELTLKQEYLRKEILESDYDTEKFLVFVENERDEGKLKQHFQEY